MTKLHREEREDVAQSLKIYQAATSIISSNTVVFPSDTDNFPLGSGAKVQVFLQEADDLRQQN